MCPARSRGDPPACEQVRSVQEKHLRGDDDARRATGLPELFEQEREDHAERIQETAQEQGAQDAPDDHHPTPAAVGRHVHAL